jgi:hypothetical protein
MDLNSIYEATNFTLQIVIEQRLTIHLAAGPISISVPVSIVTYFVGTRPFQLSTILGLTLFPDKLRELDVKTGIDVLAGSISFSNLRLV